MEKLIEVTVDSQNNNESLRFNVNTSLSKETVKYTSTEEARRSPLAAKIFGFPWTENVTIGTDYVVVAKQDWVEWEVLAEPLSMMIQEHLQMQLEQQKNGLEENPEISTPPIKSTTPRQIIDHPLAAAVQDILNQQINPMISSHGGEVTLVNIKDDVVFIQMHGGCHGCSSAQATVRHGVEVAIKSAIPEIQGVVDVTDHSQGENPYFN